MTANDIEAARALLANPDIGVTQIAQRLGVFARDALSVHSGREGGERAGRLKAIAAR